MWLRCFHKSYASLINNSNNSDDMRSKCEKLINIDYIYLLLLMHWNRYHLNETGTFQMDTKSDDAMIKVSYESQYVCVWRHWMHNARHMTYREGSWLAGWLTYLPETIVLFLSCRILSVGAVNSIFELFKILKVKSRPEGHWTGWFPRRWFRC